AADIGPCPAPQMQHRTTRRQFCDLAGQDLTAGRIFVANVNVNVLGLDDMRTDQRTLKKAVRIALKVVAVLERSGFAFVAVDAHQPRPGLAQYAAPLPAGGKAGASEPAQGGVVERFQKVILAQLAITQTPQQTVTAGSHVSIVIDIFGQMRVDITVLRR